MRRGLGLARVSKKRMATMASYDRVVDQVFRRAKGQCEVVLEGTRCARKARDFHHVVKRSAGGPDTVENGMAVCRACHDRTDTDFQRGRLVITSNGDGTFRCALVEAPSKFAARRVAL